MEKMVLSAYLILFGLLAFKGCEAGLENNPFRIRRLFLAELKIVGEMKNLRDELAIAGDNVPDSMAL